MNHTCVCPECKNKVDLAKYPGFKVGDVIECQMCGITLAVKNIVPNGDVETEIVDEGK